MEQRFKSLLVLGGIIMIAGSGYQIMIPLFPPLIKDKGISEFYVGFIFCLYPVGGLLVSFFLGTNMTIQRMKKIMLTGILLTFLGLTGFGLLIYIDNTLAFILIGSFTRLIMGIGGTMLLTPAFAFIPYLYPDRIKEIMPNMQICTGVGNFGGPAIGSLFYVIGELTPFGGYSTPFYVLGLVDLAVFPLVLKYLQTNRDKDIRNTSGSQKDVVKLSFHSGSLVVEDRIQFKSGADLEQRNSKKDRQSLLAHHIEKLSYKKIFNIYGVTISYICLCLLFTGSLGIRSYIAIYLKEEYGLEEGDSTIYFVIRPVFYALTAFTVGRIKNLNIFYNYGFGLFLTSIACFLYGPDTAFTGIPHHLWICSLADVLNGIGIANMSAVVVTMFIQIIRERHPENEQDANDIASALYISGWSVGEFAGPMIGGVLVTQFGFSRSSSLFGFTIFGSFLLYLVFLFQEYRKKKNVADIDTIDKLIE